MQFPFGMEENLSQCPFNLYQGALLTNFTCLQVHLFSLALGLKTILAPNTIYNKYMTIAFSDFLKNQNMIGALLTF